MIPPFHISSLLIPWALSLSPFGGVYPGRAAEGLRTCFARVYCTLILEQDSEQLFQQFIVRHHGERQRRHRREGQWAQPDPILPELSTAAIFPKHRLFRLPSFSPLKIFISARGSECLDSCSSAGLLAPDRRGQLWGLPGANGENGVSF